MSQMKPGINEVRKIMGYFGLGFDEITDFFDTSHGDDDVRLNYVLDDKFVLKINSARAMWEERLQEISRLIGRYRSIGVYCPALLPALDGRLSADWNSDGVMYICFVEEFAKYPLFAMDAETDRREIIEHLGLLASRYSGVDLCKARSMWSIIELALLDTDVDEKQENADILISTLRECGYTELAVRTERLNRTLREQIMTVFDELPRCMYQGDLNNSNILSDNGHFAGIIDFNMAGTDVNINVFLNETNCFPEEEDFDRLSVAEIIEQMHDKQEELLAVIFRHYEMNGVEEFAYPCYRRIVDLFQYPNVCAMRKWLKEEKRRDKCVGLINALVNAPQKI